METAIVSGASSGMGKEVALQLSKRSDPPKEIWAVARNLEKLTEVKNEASCPVRIVQADLTDPADVAKIKQLLGEEKPKVDFLANLAGFARFGMPGQVSEADIVGMINLDVRAVAVMTDIALPYMTRGSSILQWASIAAFQPLPGMNIYAASKAFVLSYSRALNNELKDKGISCTAVCPGWTKTAFITSAKAHDSNGAVTKFHFLSDPDKVVAKALKDGFKHKAMSVYGLPANMLRFFSKVLPWSLIMAVWNRTRN